jgi:hypothetical protein
MEHPIGCLVCIAVRRAELAYPGNAQRAAELGALSALAVGLAYGTAPLVLSLCNAHAIELGNLQKRTAL